MSNGGDLQYALYYAKEYCAVVSYMMSNALTIDAVRELDQQRVELHTAFEQELVRCGFTPPKKENAYKFAIDLLNKHGSSVASITSMADEWDYL